MTVVVGIDGSAGSRAAVRLAAVSQHVLRNAPCPVLVVPDGSKSR